MCRWTLGLDRSFLSSLCSLDSDAEVSWSGNRQQKTAGPQLLGHSHVVPEQQEPLLTMTPVFPLGKKHGYILRTLTVAARLTVTWVGNKLMSQFMKCGSEGVG